MKFTKMQGCGNDYVYVNGFEEKIADEKSTAIKVSNRHFGIGSDGMIIINPSEIADFEMKMYNADGTRSEMCGNGVDASESMFTISDSQTKRTLP